MRLRFFTTASLSAGVLLLLCWPWLVGSRPASSAPKQEIAQYGVRLLLYVSGTCLLFLLTAFLAILVIKQTQRDFLDRQKGNVTELIEGTLRDHGKNQP